MRLLADRSASLRERFVSDLVDSLNRIADGDANFDHWREHKARPEQLPPASFAIWYVKGGRGSGKTETAANLVTDRVLERRIRRPVIVAPTHLDLRTTVVNGDSGLLAVAKQRGIACIYLEHKNQVVWPDFGARADLRSAEAPGRIRGLNADFAWGDEIREWGRNFDETWSNIQFANRKGEAQTILTTTPLPTPGLNALMKDPRVTVTVLRTIDNIANLSPAFKSNVVDVYAGTTLGARELDGQDVEEIEGAPFKAAWIEEARWKTLPEDVRMVRLAIGVDPSGGRAEAGVVAAAALSTGDVVVLDDATAGSSVDVWSAAAVSASERWGGGEIAAERNFGGDMVEAVIKNAGARVPVVLVNASRGKFIRAEPVALLYQRGKVHHVGRFEKLEAEMTTWTPESGWSPNRMDALVWAVTRVARISSSLYAGRG